MKKIFIVLLLTSYISSYSQTGFLKWFPSEKGSLVADVIELSDSSFVVAGGLQNDISNTVQTYIVKIDKDGDLIQEKIGVISDTSSYLGLFFKLPNDPNICYMMSSNKYEKDGHKLHFNTINKLSTSNLEYSEFRRILSPVDTLNLVQSIAISDSSMFIHSKICRNFPTFEPIGFLINKYDLNITQGDSYLDYRGSNYPDYISIDQKYQRVKYYFSNIGNICVKNFNYTLLPTSEQIVMPNTPYLSSVTNMFDSTFLITSIVRNSTAIDHIKIVKLNQNDQKIDSTEYYNHPDSVLYAGISCNTAIVNDKIFVVGSKNLNPYQYPWQSTPTWLQITRIDSCMNILDHHFYGGDAVYMPYKILKTLDGGAVVIGNRYDCFDPASNNLNPFILKVDKNGLITDVSDNPNPFLHSAIVFPNPGKEMLTLTSDIHLNQGVFTLFDMKGCPVMKKVIHSAEMQFDASQLISGAYLWQIEINHKVVETGKWIKE
jgi:hypothetical protein